ncbi:MAG TPA: hypothetical protein VH678_00055 [Xanthobacteraceae bacterium]
MGTSTQAEQQAHGTARAPSSLALSSRNVRDYLDLGIIEGLEQNGYLAGLEKK